MKGKLLLTVAGFLIMLLPGNIAIAAPSPSGAGEQIELSLRSSPSAEFKTTVSITSPKWQKWMKTLKQADSSPEPAPAYSVMELSVPGTDGTGQVYRVTSLSSGMTLHQYDTRQSYLVPDNMKDELAELQQKLAGKHFGQALTWPEADKQMPKGTVLSITDLETGLTFRGQRRAGSAHMDVQPLTKEDTAIMKSIYGGHWSWQRRAVLVGSSNGVAGASMHGMPHGGDGIPDNDFNGHFCIHFAGSITHGSAHSDPAHQAMAQKASGRLEDYHKSLSPPDTIQLFLVAVNQKDRHIVELLLHTQAEPELSAEWLDEKILTVRPLGETSASRIPNDALEARFKTRVAISRKGAPPQGIWFWWTLARTAPAGAWFIKDIQPEAVIR